MRQERKEHEESIGNLLVSLEKGKTANPAQTTSRSHVPWDSTVGFLGSLPFNEIVHGKRAISADTALRLSRYFGMSDRFWINLQARYDIEREKDLLAGRLDREVRPRAAAG